MLLKTKEMILEKNAKSVILNTFSTLVPIEYIQKWYMRIWCNYFKEYFKDPLDYLGNNKERNPRTSTISL